MTYELCKDQIKTIEFEVSLRMNAISSYELIETFGNNKNSNFEILLYQHKETKEYFLVSEYYHQGESTYFDFQELSLKSLTQEDKNKFKGV
ncbi:MAG: hypothetical protein ACRCW9_06605 [Cetobacterium sp.]